MTIIEQIKAEIERRITDNTFGAKLELIDILAWLDTLESEKPMNQEGLEKDVEHWFFNEISSKINVEHTMYHYFQECAHRYAQWGAEHLKK